MKKYLFFIMPLFVAVVISCTQQKGPTEQDIQARIDSAVAEALAKQSTLTSNSSSDYSSSGSISDNSTSSSSSSTESTIPSPVGKYTFNDDYNSYTLIINSDESCQIHSDGTTYYGSWREWFDKCYSLEMSDVLHLRVNGNTYSCYYPKIDISMQWMYCEIEAWKAKNPNKRVKLEKIE